MNGVNITICCKNTFIRYTLNWFDRRKIISRNKIEWKGKYFSYYYINKIFVYEWSLKGPRNTWDDNDNEINIIVACYVLNHFL
jgi:hypothetical protein